MNTNDDEHYHVWQGADAYAFDRASARRYGHLLEYVRTGRDALHPTRERTRNLTFHAICEGLM